MSISLPGKRRKESLYNDIQISLSPGIPSSIDSQEGVDKIFLPVVASEPISLPILEVQSITTLGSDIINATGNGFAQVEVGNIVSGAGIQPNTVVIEKTSSSRIKISSQATATGNDILLGFQSAIIPTYYAVEISHSLSNTGEEIITSVILHKYDGTLGGAIPIPTSSSEKITLVPAPGAKKDAMKINIDRFFSNLGVPPSP